MEGVVAQEAVEAPEVVEALRLQPQKDLED